jgi:hypothetical protein
VTRRINRTQFTLVVVLISFLGFSAPGNATNPSYELDPPTKVVITGCQAGNNQCYLVTSPVPSQNCMYNGTIFINLDSTGTGQAMYATAMMIQSTGKSVRVVYSQAGGSGGVCTASLVAMSN